MKVNIFWFRRDLRVEDNHGLYEALKEGNVLPLFIFDKVILDELEDKKDRRVHFIHESLKILKERLEEAGGGLMVRYGEPLEVYRDLVKEFDVEAVYTNGDYEPYAKERDEKVEEFLKGEGVGFKSFKDQVCFEKKEILTDGGGVYKVFTPYSKKWKSFLKKKGVASYRSEDCLEGLWKGDYGDFLGLGDIGFEESDGNFPDRKVVVSVLKNYSEMRDFPAERGTSRLSVHLRFGTVSVRKLVSLALKYSETWLNELIWREFYMMILWNFPKVVGAAFKEQYNGLKWVNNENDFEAWCEGRTGYALVDAGMRELNETGFMHNRVRMVTASFLVKHLMVDWRWGEAYFAKKLLDFDLAANNGGWQWAASTGCDSVPYFRIFNPELQLKRFDPDLEYVKKWVPEFGSEEYPERIVEHKFARERALSYYKSANLKK